MCRAVNIVSTCTLAITSLFISGSMARGQSGSSPHPTILLKLPEEVDAGKVLIYYFMSGAFGGYGRPIQGKTGTKSYTIDAAVGDSSAVDVKVIAWLPGCQMPAFDIRAQQQKIERALECKPLASAHLKGQFNPTSVFVPRDDLGEITVDYLAHWACRFFGTADCMVPQFRVGAASQHDRSFEIDLPDLATQSGMDDGSFSFILREKRTGNILAFLHPRQNGSLTHNLKVLHEYDPVVHFETEELVPSVQ